MFVPRFSLLTDKEKRGTNKREKKRTIYKNFRPGDNVIIFTILNYYFAIIN